MQTPPEEQPQETTSLLGRNRDLAVLYAIAGYLNHQIDVHEALQEVLAKVTEMLGLRTGWVWLLNEQGSPYPAASQALPPYLADHPERMTGSCLCLDTFLSGGMEKAANIDVLRCSRLKNAERDSDPSALGLRFHASIPIYAGDTPIGVFNVASEDWRGLQVEELQLLHIISDQIGLAVQRARLSADHTRAAARLATIEERNRLAREIHDTLAQGLAAITLQQEAVTNALRHANAQYIEMTLTATEQIINLVIQDDGNGFDPDTVTQTSGHFGLTGMTERARLLNGTTCIQSEPGTGTRIDVRVPY